jgi:hypothetical protein
MTSCIEYYSVSGETSQILIVAINLCCFLLLNKVKRVGYSSTTTHWTVQAVKSRRIIVAEVDLLRTELTNNLFFL